MPASFNRISLEFELLSRLRSPDVAGQMKSKLREVGLRPTRPRVAAPRLTGQVAGCAKH